ncbi:hypothetical protein OF001_U20264 [Pseudomonas sp. OF001]|uniref:hypothetical protein n=1 Tax=Pseudomonas sp. OF001 TaxID=2772300 RepID=UPI00191B1F9E|nr:hypothetical protein [Pseudomonas sp. OF001]CAD5377337.1 hypothetical protein OF001_U20264 [Pseudomonas sp. OF001]
MTPHEQMFRMPDDEEVIAFIAEFNDHSAEEWCRTLLQRLPVDPHGDRTFDDIYTAFAKHGDYLPLTVEECRREMRFWDELDKLRDPVAPGHGISFEASDRVKFVEYLIKVYETPDLDDGEIMFID